MSTLTERDRLLKASWRDARHVVPDPHPGGEHFSVQVLGVIDDSAFQIEGDPGAFVEFVSWWPALRRWTVTHTNKADDQATDFPCKVTYWQPSPPLPWE